MIKYKNGYVNVKEQVWVNADKTRQTVMLYYRVPFFTKSVVNA